MRYLISTVLLLLLVVACKPNSKTAEQTATQAETTTAAKANILPGLPKEAIISLYQQADYIDYIFFDWDFSMNQSEIKAVQAAVTFISDQRPTSIDGCKAIGRLVFQSTGNIIREADMFFSDGCYFYTFVNESNRPEFHNAMTEQGISFYGKMFKQAFTPAQ